MSRPRGEPYDVLLACGHQVRRSVHGGRVELSYYCPKDKSDEVVLRFRRRDDLILRRVIK